MIASVWPLPSLIELLRSQVAAVTVDSRVPVARGASRSHTPWYVPTSTRFICVRRADISSELLASATPGFSGADLYALINSAALIAANRGAEVVEMPDIEDARDKIIMGASPAS